MDTVELIEFGKRVKEIRRRLNISQKDFASTIGISSSSLSEIESGKTKPGYEFFKNITLEYNVNNQYLHTGKGDIFLDSDAENSSQKKIDFGENKKIIEEMIWYFNHVPVVKFAMLEFFKSYLFEKKEMIEEEIEKIQESDKDNKE
jgi:transcriptional regulator with XRE-family HTH domain